MPDIFADPIASREEFQNALLTVRDRHKIKESQLKMLRCQYAAPNHTISAGGLSSAMGFEKVTTGNLQYAAFAHLVADVLGYQAPKTKGHGPQWWTTFSLGRADPEQTTAGQFEWVMRPELAEALKEMNWV